MSNKKQRTRNIKLEWSPEVHARVYSRRIDVKTGGYAGQTKYVATGELSVGCAVELIRKLRAGLREIRDYQARTLNAAVDRAEGPL